MANESEQEKRETLADIVAEMREKAAHFEKNSELMVSENAIALFILPYADRIEAAWKREKAEAEADALAVGGIVEAARHTPGNTAATRKALKTIHDKVNSLDEECGVDPVEIRNIARAALSAPARNCDIMSRSTCTKHFSTIYEGNRDGLCDVQTEREKNIHLYYIAFNKWLFAPAAERKGEGDGSK